MLFLILTAPVEKREFEDRGVTFEVNTPSPATYPRQQRQPSSTDRLRSW
jgi:hypothetical protein